MKDIGFKIVKRFSIFILIVSIIFIIFAAIVYFPITIVHYKMYFENKAPKGEYEIIVNEKHAYINRLGRDSINKETLVLPTVYNNNIIEYVSKDDGGYLHIKNNIKEEGLISKEVENLYVNSNYELYDTSIMKLYFLEKIYIGNLTDNIIVAIEKNSNFEDLIAYISTNNYDSTDFYHYKDHFKIANVVYYNNYSEAENEVFLVDYCSNTLTNVTPDDPYREGYKFDGWYKEEECNNKWDFAKDIVEAPIYDTDGVHILNETKLYAKWEKVN